MEWSNTGNTGLLFENCKTSVTLASCQVIFTNDVCLPVLIHAWRVSRRRNKKLVAVVASEERNCLAPPRGEGGRREENGVPFISVQSHTIRVIC